MNEKKKLPIIILRSLEPFVNLTGEKFKIIEPKNNLLHIIDIDESSGFYFKIEKFEKRQNGSFQFLMDRKPTDIYENGNYRTWIEIKNLESQFKQWIQLLIDFDDVNSFYDDHIIKANAERFFQKFEIIDENSDIVSFDLEQQLFLEEYLKNSKEKLKKLKKNETDDVVAEIEILERETDEIKSALTRESKKKIMIRLSKFWGRAQKTGLNVVKEVFVNVAAEFAKRLLLGP